MRPVLHRATRLVRPPTPLVALLGATAILALGWIAAVPPFQAPDENGHFAYVQVLAERGEIPESAGPPTLSTELNRAVLAANSLQTQQQLGTKPEWAKSVYDQYLHRAAREDAATRGDGGPTPAAVNPPLYYLWELPAYSIASGGDLFARVTAMRLWTIPFLLTTVAATWLLAGVVFGPRLELQFAAAAVPALFPMVGFISSSINPDGLLYALWSVAFLFGARVLVGRGGIPDLIGLLVVFGMALATKAVSFALAPAIILVLGVLLWRNRANRTLVTAAGVCAGLLITGTVAWLVLGGDSGGSAVPQLGQATSLDNFRLDAFASYLWQFYLPSLPFQTGYPELAVWPPRGYEFWVEKSWAAFGWLEVRWPMEVYWLLAAAGLLVALGAGAAIWQRRARVNPTLLAFFLLATVSLLVGLHLSEFAVLRDSHALLNQGRYLFPLISLAGLAAGAMLTVVPARARRATLGIEVGALASLSLLSIGLTAARFYA